jgi:iron complex transport system permease protein
MRWSLPTAAGFGAVFTVWVDAASRWALAPKELPFSVMTAAVGGVFFMVILRRRRSE